LHALLHATGAEAGRGRGIDPTAPPGFGTRGMQERVQALGGSYKVESARGSGTCVRIAIPLHDERP